MKDLYFSELRRFRWLALAAAVVNLLLLVFLNRVTNLLQMSFLEALPMLFIFMSVGLVLAIAQVGSYRKPSQWTWLMHRPLAPSRIFGALALSALTLLTVAISLPMLALVIGTDVMTTRVVDLRHYLLIAHLLGFTMMAWMAGAHACVSRSRAAIAIFFAPLVLSLHLVSTIALLVPVMLTLVWLGYITLRSFRANREAPIQGIATLLATALPLQLGLFLFCAVIFRFLFVTGGILLGVDPLNTDYPPKGGLIETERSEPHEEIALGLVNSEDPRASSWQTQLPLLEPTRFGPWLKRFPLHQQLSNFQLPTGWYDKERKIDWTFSHDEMLFIGRDPESGTTKGVFGRGGANETTPFLAVPVATDEGDLLTPHTLYGIDDDTQTVEQRLALQMSEKEQFTAMPQRAFDRVLILTNQRLIVLREDHRAAANIKPLLSDWAIELPRGSQNLESVTLAELMDGWLVSFVYGNGMRQIGFSQFNTTASPWQQVLFVDADGNGRVVGEREINPDFPVLQRTYWWVSPVMDLVRTMPEMALDKGLTWPMTVTIFPRAPALYTALVLILLSTGAAWWWIRGTRMPVGRRRVWLVNCALIGLPALLSLFLLEPREVKQREARI
ncbi:hypothetical protein [Microbulbifer sp. ALW1]|uniref:hypothetical protein n=1 Tax=Microbulbifer sp. (strain ALW1) TaxID=1516059 RepID=UPI0013567F21|nr:hypothetical protein [Microbulbifer sp. ALW1]